jgi:glycine cleavage system aminomethyltransferase T
VLATGAIERPLVFPGNDLPGVMMASAAQTYAARFAVKAGSRAVVFTTTDSGWAAARDLQAHGITVAAVLDARSAPNETAMRELRENGTECLAAACVTGTRGWHALKSVDAVDGDGRARRFDADLLAISGGWNPNVALACHLGGRPVWTDSIAAYTLKAAPRHISLAGSATGRFSLQEALLDGTRIGAEVSASCGFKAAPSLTPKATEDACEVATWFSALPPLGRAFVDFQHDVTDRDITIATREGFTSVEHLKRYTTLGMATDQGRTSNVNGSALLAAATGRSIADTGSVLARAPAVPVAIAAFAAEHSGTHFRPVRRTPSHQFATDRGAVFMDAGLWRRAQWFPLAGESDWRQTVDREVKAVRSGVGVCDVSTLGKIDVQGPDAAALLDRVYINTFSTLPVGKARYGVMLREDGLVMDDGTTARLDEHHYVVTTTTANAAIVMRHLEYVAQVLFPTLDVQLASVTEQWAQFAVAGPSSRRLLEQLFGTQLDLSNRAFPYMSACATTWRGIPARLLRLSFSGELAYEVAVPTRHAEQLLFALMECGKAFGVVPYGTEALGVMRIEKGHVGGNEMNGQTTAADLGFARMMSNKKDFIGRVMASRPGLVEPDRLTLVGVKLMAADTRLTAGAHFVSREGSPRSQGHLTSVALSPTLGHSIGLGLLRRGAERLGERIRVFDALRGLDIEVEVCSPHFVDPAGARLRA